MSLPPPPPASKLWEVSAARPAPAKTTTTVAVASPVPFPPPLASPTGALLAGAGLLTAALAAKAVFGRPARAYQPGSVGREYDAWTREGILEYYWGAAVWRRTPVVPPTLGANLAPVYACRRAHPPRLLQRGGAHSALAALGSALAHGRAARREEALKPQKAADAPTSAHAGAQELAAGYKKKDFKAAKFDFTDRMLEFSGVSSSPAKVLDVGCGIGGTTRHLAKKFGSGTELTGITLSPNQVRRFGRRFPWRRQAACCC